MNKSKLLENAEENSVAEKEENVEEREPTLNALHTNITELVFLSF